MVDGDMILGDDFSWRQRAVIAMHSYGVVRGNLASACLFEYVFVSGFVRCMLYVYKL